jgi:hypothetical protein
MSDTTFNFLDAYLKKRKFAHVYNEYVCPQPAIKIPELVLNVCNGILTTCAKNFSLEIMNDHILPPPIAAGKIRM